MFKKGSATIVLIILLLLGAGIFMVVRSSRNVSPNNSVNPTIGVSPSPSPSKDVSLPTQEDVVRLFFQLINDQKASEAVKMLSQSAAPDDTTRQTWSVNFNSIKSVTIKSLKKSSENVYKVVLDIQLKNGDFQYGWYNGENIRWIEIVKENNLYKINTIGTGP